MEREREIERNELRKKCIPKLVLMKAHSERLLRNEWSKLSWIELHVRFTV